MSKIKAPFYPIIYVRGYAMTEGEIKSTTSTPYMGFNLGSTKVRQNWKGDVKKHIFESPLIRLMKDYKYVDNYENGIVSDKRISSRSIIIYRYYDEGDTDFGSGKALSIPEAAEGLNKLILDIRKQICGDDQVAKDAFKVYLVAHSMGGLVCRSFLQNTKFKNNELNTVKMVDKVFTYATPHNGIDMAGLNAPSFLSLWDINNFNREKMASYLGLPDKSKRVDSLGGKFPPERFFCLVGTNYKDYDVAYGVSSKLAGQMSDGLVKMSNATIEKSPRAFVYRSHSGPYGIVNSEEGYQNLVRFLFGDVKVTGVLEVENLPLPPSIQKAFTDKKDIKASYLFESTLTPRGAFSYKLTERRKETSSAILRKFKDLFKSGNIPADNTRSPVLFSTFLDKKNITYGRTIVFGLDLSVSTTGYEIDGFLWLNTYIEGESLFRDFITVRATPSANGWNVRYNFSDEKSSESPGTPVKTDNKGMYIPLVSAKGFEGKLRLQTDFWK